MFDYFGCYLEEEGVVNCKSLWVVFSVLFLGVDDDSYI